MNNNLLNIYVVIHRLMHREEGQDLVEYGLVFAVISCACIASMGSLAGGIDTAFSTVGRTLTSNV
jgi:Flp pilus assembly pilin Flp